MDPATMASAAAVAASAVGSYGGQAGANFSNKDIWRKTQNWSEYMSNTAWQRGVADMKKAGINPMLSFSQGGANVPSSAIGAPQQDAVGRGISSALQASTLNASLAEIKSRAALNLANAASANSNSAKNAATKPVYDLIGDVMSSLTNSARSLFK